MTWGPKRTKMIAAARKTMFFCCSLAFFLPLTASAHQPRIVSGRGPVVVAEPEVSRVYYGKLNGAEQWFRISSSRTFELYLGILSPKVAGAVTDTRVLLFKDTVRNGEDKVTPAGLIKELNWPYTEWHDYYENFGGDWYLRGPEFRKILPAGDYAAVVTRKGEPGEGRYALAIGGQEKFPPPEIIKALILLPKLKASFFDKSPWTAYFNLAGLYLAALILILAGSGYLVSYIINKIRNRAEPESMK